MEEYETAVLQALEVAAWQDRNYLKAEQTRANGYEYHHYTNLIRSLEDRKLVERRSAERGRCPYEYRITNAGVRELDQNRANSKR